MAIENTHFGPDRIRTVLAAARSVFFIGVGGINMSSLALITKQRGYRVGGSDRTATALTEKLAASGIEVSYGHSASHIEGFDAVVFTIAISPDNEEYRYAVAHDIPCFSRADYLGYIMTGYTHRIGISGMHGKSTCTSMCAELFIHADTDPTVLSGAELPSMGGAYRIGGQEHFIFEACEYRDSFLDMNPNIAILLNIEMDHPDYFASLEQIQTSFASFAAFCRDGGTVIANADDSHVRETLAAHEGNLLTFGIRAADADFRAVNITYPGGKPSFDILCRGIFFAHVNLSVIGLHNVYNALAAAAAAYLCAIPPETVAEGLARYRGASRRMEYRGKLDGADVYEDYAHHPSEIEATLAGVARMGYERIRCVFQPHTYSRTAALFEEFVAAFDAADDILFADIYPARETNTWGVFSADLAAQIGERAIYLDSFEAIARELTENSQKGDVILVMGAGDIYQLFDHLSLD